jgi:hypothetical protein
MRRRPSHYFGILQEVAIQHCQRLPLQLRRVPNSDASLKRSANGRPPGPGRWYAVHFHRPGLGVLPSAPALSNVKPHSQHLLRTPSSECYLSFFLSTSCPTTPPTTAPTAAPVVVPVRTAPAVPPTAAPVAVARSLLLMPAQPVKATAAVRPTASRICVRLVSISISMSEAQLLLQGSLHPDRKGCCQRQPGQLVSGHAACSRKG